MTQEIEKQICTVRKSAKTFTQRKSRSSDDQENRLYWIGTWMWQQNLSCSAELLEYTRVRCDLCQNRWLPFLGLAITCCLSDICTMWLCCQRQRLRKDLIYPWLWLWWIADSAFRTGRSFLRRSWDQERKSDCRIQLKSNSETGIFWYRESHCQNRVKIGLVMFCFLEDKKNNFLCIWNQYRFTVENSGNAEVSKKNKVKSKIFTLPYHLPSS